MSEFKVGDRVITRWDYLAEQEYNITDGEIPDGEHTIIKIEEDACRLAGFDKWYPLDNITKVDDATTAELKECAGIDFRDECAMRVMQAFLSVGDVKYNIFLSDPRGRELTRWIAEDSYAYADAMFEARKK